MIILGTVTGIGSGAAADEAAAGPARDIYIYIYICIEAFGRHTICQQ